MQSASLNHVERRRAVDEASSASWLAKRRSAKEESPWVRSLQDMQEMFGETKSTSDSDAEQPEFQCEGSDSGQEDEEQEHDTEGVDLEARLFSGTRDVGLNERLQILSELRQLMPNRGGKTPVVVLADMAANGDVDSHHLGALLQDEVEQMFTRPDMWRKSLAGKCNDQHNGRVQGTKHKWQQSDYMEVTNGAVKKLAERALKPLLPLFGYDVLYQCALRVPNLCEAYWMNSASCGALERVFTNERFWCDKLAADAKAYNDAVAHASDPRWQQAPFYGFSDTTQLWDKLYKDTVATSGNKGAQPLRKMLSTLREEATENPLDPKHIEQYRVFCMLEMTETWLRGNRQSTQYRFNYKNMYWLCYFDNWISVLVQNWSVATTNAVNARRPTLDDEVNLLDPAAQFRANPLARSFKGTWQSVASGLSREGAKRSTGIPFFDGFVRFVATCTLPPPFASLCQAGKLLSSFELSMCLCQALIVYKRSFYQGERMELPNFFFKVGRH